MKTFAITQSDFMKVSGIICGWAFHRSNGETHEIKFISKTAEKHILEIFLNSNIQFKEIKKTED